MDGSRDTASRLFRIAAHERRRLALGRLAEHARLTLPDLADELAAAEHGTDVADVPAETVTRTYFDLYHRHVPRLADAELVRYDQDRDLVSITDRGQEFAGWLEDAVDDLPD